ncbi:MAG: hypothetical protein MZV70_07840 [Desulfobacterales bacterium]|nr:hypothetical protein [Desulfobacterales bacterium]
MAVGRHGYVGAVEVEGGRVNIAAAVDPAFLKAARDGIRAPSRRSSRRPASARARLSTAIDWMGTIPLTRRLVPSGGARRLRARRRGRLRRAVHRRRAWPGPLPARKRWCRSRSAPWTRTAAALERRMDPRATRDAVGRDQRWCRLVASCLQAPALVDAARDAAPAAPGLRRARAGALLASAPTPAH